MRECICTHLGSSLCQCYGDAPQTLPYLVHEGLRPQEVTEADTQEAAHTRMQCSEHMKAHSTVTGLGGCMTAARLTFPSCTQISPKQFQET